MRDGVIESEEREMIYNVFDFSDAVVKGYHDTPYRHEHHQCGSRL